MNGMNLFIPSHEASGKLIVAFSRNQNDFPLNQYATIAPTKQRIGYYLEIDPAVAARLGTQDEHVWPIDSAPDVGVWNTADFSWKQFNTTRYLYPYTIPQPVIEQLSWEVTAHYAAAAAQQAMTNRTRLVWRAIQNVLPSLPSGHVATATAWGGGKWNVGSTGNPYIMRGLSSMVERILLATTGVVTARDLCLVVSPKLARAMASSPEIREFVARSPFAEQYLMMEKATGQQPGTFFLPPTLYGVRVVVEDTVLVSSLKGQSLNANFVLPDDTAYLVARPGELVSPVAGAPTFSTLTIFMYEEMTVETKTDQDWRRFLGRVVEDYDIRVTAPLTIAVATECL